MKERGTATSAMLADFKPLYGKPTITFGMPDGRSHHWYRSPYIVLNEWADGTRTSYETVQRDEPKPMTYGY